MRLGEAIALAIYHVAICSVFKGAVPTRIRQTASRNLSKYQAQAAMIANGCEEGGESIKQSQTQIPKFQPVQMPGDYLRRSAITGQMETVTEYGNGVQSVSPVGH